MKGLAVIMPLLLAALPVEAQLEVMPEDRGQIVFAGEQTVRVACRNLGTNPVAPRLRRRLYQHRSSTTMPVTEPQLWNALTGRDELMLLSQEGLLRPEQVLLGEGLRLEAGWLEEKL